MFRIRTIRMKLFFTYSLFIIISISLFAGYFYYYTANDLKKRAYESISQSATYVSTQLDTEFRNLDFTAVKVIFSETIKDVFFNRVNLSDRSALFADQRKINESVYSIMGPLPLDWQINLFDFQGKFIGVGNYSLGTFFPKKHMEDIEWAKSTMQLDGERYISPPHMDNWSKPDKLVISVARKFYWDLGSQKSGVVEVQQEYALMVKLIEKLISHSSNNQLQNKNLYILNERGEIIYPNDAGLSKSAYFYWSKIKDKPSQSKMPVYYNPIADENEIVAYSYSDYTNWSVIAVQSETLLLKPVRNFRNTMLVALIGILLITLAVSFFVAKSMTSPIKQMHRSIRALNVENLIPTSLKETNQGLNELEVLNNSFRRMCLRLQESIDETILSKSQEMQARMVALQSQMNPHFLNNTITAISIMAEEQGQEAIVKVCRHLSGMLRYILSNSHHKVTIADEIGYAQSYLSLLKVRYVEFLEYDIQVPPEMEQILIPKLVIQPIIENWIKYGIDVKPPWFIRIEGAVSEGQWSIRITDNGTGFSEEMLRDWKDGNDKRSISIEAERKNGGLGLRNIDERLHLLYGDHAIFEIYNEQSGGASVRIGGQIHMLKQSEPGRS